MVETEVPPLLNVPVWSMATLNGDNDDHDGCNTNVDNESEVHARSSRRTTNMNLLTYATPVSIRPYRLYALGLYKETKSRNNFLREKTCVLQLLSEDHISCVRLLGGMSGKDVHKEDELSSVHGIELQDLTAAAAAKGNGDDVDVPVTDADGGELPKVLPGCVRYLKLSMLGDNAIDCNDGGEGSHDVVLCRVDKMWTSTTTATTATGVQANQKLPHSLMTDRLRELGLITEQGRIAPSTME